MVVYGDEKASVVFGGSELDPGFFSIHEFDSKL